MADVTAVFVTYNSAGIIGEALAALPREIRCIVVDNASADGTQTTVLTARPDADVMTNRRNIGFGRAANRALAAVGTEFAVLLNPDLFVAPDCVEALLATARRHEDVALFGAVEEGGQAPTRSSDVYPIETVSGACMLFRMAQFEKIGFFDENLFMYFEDSDISLRARLHGFGVAVASAARVRHLGGRSTGSRFDDSLEKSWLLGGACHYFAQKHAGQPEGRAARRKFFHHRKNLLISRLVGNRKRELELAARLQGAEAVRKLGPGTMFSNSFTGDAARTAALSERLSA
jgi:N-acetylglucosaminyl-diphospho-decaprenol L-rhamnosyltransferase